MMKKTITKQLKSKKIRALYNKKTNSYLFCAVDICAILCNTKHSTAKNYWQTKKRRDSFFDIQKGYQNKTLTLPARDGKFYKTDVIDIETIMYLIKTISHGNSLVYKLLLKKLGVGFIVEIFNKKAQEENKKITSHAKKEKKTIYLSTTVYQRPFSLKETLIDSLILQRPKLLLKLDNKNFNC